MVLVYEFWNDLENLYISGTFPSFHEATFTTLESDLAFMNNSHFNNRLE